MSGVAEGASAALYVASNIYSWSEARKMPDRQAEANKKVLVLQKQQYDGISAEMRGILNIAIDTYLSEINTLLNGNDFEKAFPSIPQVAEFVPVDACCIQASTIACNVSNADSASNYVKYVNRLNEQNDLVHILSMDPRFLVTLDIQSKSIQDLARGILPIGDVVEILSDNAEMASLTGRIGNTRKTTARDLGISKLRAQAVGRKEFREATTWANSSVSPMQRQHEAGEMMQSVEQRINLALQQSQLIQQSLQNKNNALAQKEPYLLAELQTKIQNNITRLQAKSSEALLVNTHVPNFAATIMPKVDNMSGLVGSIGDGIKAAQTSHYFGRTNEAQDGYSGSNNTGSSGYRNRGDSKSGIER